MNNIFINILWNNFFLIFKISKSRSIRVKGLNIAKDSDTVNTLIYFLEVDYSFRINSLSKID